MNVRTLIISIVILVSTVSIGAIISTPASAQSAPERRLQVSPLRNEISVEAGAAYKGSISLKNTGKATLKVTLSAEAFDVINQNYDYEFIPKAPVSEWVHFTQSDVIIDEGETYVADYLISVPIGAEPGGKYISLFASALPSTNDGITSVDRIGSLVYLTVPGDITSPGELVSLKSPLTTTSDFSWSATIRNGGTAHFRSNYAVTAQTLWNTDITKTEGSGLILPASVRLIQGSGTHPEWLGVYKVHYQFGLGDNPTVDQTKLLFYLPPLQTIAAVGLLLAFISLLISSLRHRSKRRHLKHKD